MPAARTISIALSCALLALVAGLWLGGHPESLPEPLRSAFVDEEAAARAELIETIEENFYEEVDEEALEQASLKGIVQSLDDRFSQYFTPEETEALQQSLQGEFDGVGMTVDAGDRGLVVVSVFEDSPAEGAGIRPEDVITRVNGRSIAGVPLELATARIKGEAGTDVTLTVLRPDSGDRRTVKVERARIVVPITEGEIRRVDGVELGVVELSSFSSGAHGQLRQEIERLLEEGAKGLVLDLRDNGGGLLQEGVLVASIFIEDGEVVSTDGRTKPERVFEARGDAIDEDIPVVVLVNRGTASASEIVAGALRDRERAIVAGTRTFGKGVFQEIEQLDNGGALDLTVGQYFLPDGDNLTENGIRPAVRARDLPRTERDEALPIALETLRDEL
ncbi:MAG: S41 family peptidase [Thermoleophilaceae bacterium]